MTAAWNQDQFPDQKGPGMRLPLTSASQIMDATLAPVHLPHSMADPGNCVSKDAVQSIGPIFPAG